MTTPYTKLPHSLIRNPKLSYGATGLLAFMYSMAPGWKFTLQDLSRRKINKRFGTRKLLRELEQCGLVKKLKITGEKGRIKEWNFQLSPESNFQILDNQPQIKKHLASKKTKKPDSCFGILDGLASNDKKFSLKSPESNLPEVDLSTCGKPDTKYYQEESIIKKKEFIKSDNNFSSSRKGVSENTGKILESYEANFSKSPKGKSAWIDYLESRNDITPEMFKEIFDRMGKERIRLEESTGFKNHTPPTLPEVKRAIEDHTKAKQRAEEDRKKQEQQKPASHSGQQANPQEGRISAATGAATVRQACQEPEPVGNQTPAKEAQSEPVPQEICKAITPNPVQPAPEAQKPQEKRNSISFLIPDDKTALTEAAKKFPDLNGDSLLKWLNAYRQDWKKTKRTDGTTSINEYWLDAFQKYFNRTKARPICPA